MVPLEVFTMDSVILFSSEAEIAKVVDLSHRLAGKAQVAVVGLEGANLSQCSAHAAVFQDDQSIWSSLTAAVQNSRSTSISLINATAGISVDEMMAMAVAVLATDRKIGTFSLTTSTEELTCAQLSAAEIPNILSKARPLPLAGIKVSKAFLLSQIMPDVKTPEGIVSSLLVSAAAEFQTIDSDLAFIHSKTMTLESAVPSLQERGALLRQTVNQINIEELFPNRPWEHGQNEAAAACYQQLAAQFISLQEYSSAEECITLSERMEDSPRCLALKGIVAMLKGEELEAVANMVSSLQEYERFKKESSHVLMKINPTSENLEQINAALQSGLEALNARNNSGAASHFADALFKFDSFFSENGLQMPQ
jgi:hypothetical protein